VTTAVEHEAVLESVAFLERLGCRVSRVGVDRSGKLDVEELVSNVDEHTAVVSVMAANNETGLFFPLDEISASARAIAPGVLFHTDAVQAVITEEITVETTQADMISMAAHKFGGPKGVGLLYVPREVELEPVLHGGGQELGRRSGTHNVAAIVGMVAALRATVAGREATRSRIERIRDEFESELLAAVPDLVVTGSGLSRLVQHSHIRIPGVDAETLLIRLDQEGVAAAAGSACNSGAVEVSHVLAAMGMTEQEAAECVRFSFGWSSEADAGTTAARLVSKLVGELR
jgi:cysteine desulfurase